MIRSTCRPASIQAQHRLQNRNLALRCSSARNGLRSTACYRSYGNLLDASYPS
ncbi:Uncharacterised protein [Vibrio cholerae]|nr:Uncharacterised protein [Vibrio cholerae]